MAGWIISAHGSYESSGTHTLFLYDTEVRFWVKHDQTLWNTVAWPVFNALIKGKSPVPGPSVVKYDQVLSYVAYGTKDFPSGIFEVGTGKCVLALAKDERLGLSTILSRADCPAVVNWLCCTNIA